MFSDDVTKAATRPPPCYTIGRSPWTDTSGRIGTWMFLTTCTAHGVPRRAELGQQLHHSGLLPGYLLRLWIPGYVMRPPDRLHWAAAWYDRDHHYDK